MAVNINHATDTITASSGTLTLPNFSGGGGGLTHFAESESTTSPNGTVAVDALTATDAGRINIDVALVAKGTGATLAQVPDGTNAGGNKRGEYATDFQKFRYSQSAAATGNYSSILGGTNNAAGGYGSAAVGGQSNDASGSTSLAGGSNCGATAFASVALGGYYNYATADYAVAVGGYFNAASAPRAVAIGGEYLQANSAASVVLGGTYGSTRGIVGYCVTPASSDPLGFYHQGASQAATLVLAGQTSSYVSAKLKSDSNSLSASNQLTLPANSAYSVRGEMISAKPYGGDVARWIFEVVLKCGNAGTISLLSPSTITKTHDDSVDGMWGAYLTTNSTFNCLEINVYGANDLVNWVCRLQTVEMSASSYSPFPFPF